MRPQADRVAGGLRTYDDDPDTYRFYSDREWNCIDHTYQDLAAAEARALFELPGVVFVDA
jgi:hypothetical protein